MPGVRRFRILSSIILLSGSISLSAQSAGTGISISRWPVELNFLPYLFRTQTETHTKNEHSMLKAPNLILPDNMATAFFCRMEVKAEKASKIPVLFRLGSVDHVEKLEGKRKDMFIR